MKRGTKITLIVIGTIVGIITLVLLSADVIVSNIVRREVNKSLAALPHCKASCGDIHLRLFSGTARIEDLRFVYQNEAAKQDSLIPGVSICIDRIDIGHVYYRLLMGKRLVTNGIRIYHPQVELHLDEAHPTSCIPSLQDLGLDTLRSPMEYTHVKHLDIRNADLRVRSVRSTFAIEIDSLCLSAQDIVYDSIWHYCDSIYSFSIAHSNIELPTKCMRIEARAIRQSDQGELAMGSARIGHTIAHKKLSDLIHDNITWMDVEIESMRTTPFNLIRKAMINDYTLDAIRMVVKHAHLYREERYEPSKPYPMPQEQLCAIPIDFMIKHMDMFIRKFTIGYVNTQICCEGLPTSHLRLSMDNITNKRGSIMYINSSLPIQQGMAKMALTMTLNKACDFDYKMHVTDINANFLNNAFRPFIGVTCEMQVDQLDTHFSGNSTRAEGTFKMLYQGLKVTLHDEGEIPDFIKKNAKLFTGLANSLLVKSNPTAVDIAPRAYKIEWKRDAYKPFPFYIIGPYMDGIKKTLLPGLYIHKQIIIPD